MTTTMNQDLNSELFEELVTSLAQSALMGMGKLRHPAFQKAEVDLEAAQHAIDLLDMLEAKTRGNLSDDESRLLKQTLGMLKLNYVETVHTLGDAAASARGGANASDGNKGSAAATSDDSRTQGPSVSDTSGAKTDDDKVRFRKSYG